MCDKEKTDKVNDSENNISKSDNNNINEEEYNNTNITKDSKANSQANSEKQENNNNNDNENLDNDFSEHNYSFYNLRELLEKGDQTYSQQKYKIAIDIYKKIINKFPDKVKGYINM